jgi:hypothetical protein
MDILNKEITIDMGHLLLLAVVVVGVLFVANRCRLECSGMHENLDVPKLHQNICRCPSCSETCYQRALNGELPGCSDSNPNYDQCNDSYRKCLLFGCNVASGNTCHCKN